MESLTSQLAQLTNQHNCVVVRARKKSLNQLCFDLIKAALPENNEVSQA